jgi:hypothetical protein
MASTGSAAGGCAQWPATTTTIKKKERECARAMGLPSEDADFHSDQHSGLWLLDSGIAKERGGENMDALIGRKRPPFKAPEVLVIFL